MASTPQVGMGPNYGTIVDNQIGSNSNIGAYTVNVTSLAQSPQLLSNITSSLSSLLSTICPQLPLASALSPPVLNHPIPQPVSKTSYPLKPAVIKSDKPFFLTLLNNRIKKCSGCGHMFRDLDNFCPYEYILGHLVPRRKF